MKKSVIAIENFKSLNCAQSVLLAYAREINLDEKTALRIAGGFGAGMTMGETCGAVTGAYMVLGMKINPGDKPVQQVKTDSKEAVRKFNSLFTARHGSLKCKKLLGVDLSTPEGTAEAEARDLYNTICANLVASAAEILEENF